MSTMTQDARISSRIDRDLKNQAEAILSELGIKSSQAISMFYSQIVKHRGIPFELKIPNEETKAAMDELMDPDARKDAKRFTSVKDLMADLDS